MIKINGENYQARKENIPVLELLKERNVTSPEMVLVQLNGSFVNLESYGTTVIQNNDKVGFLYFMSGGSAG